MTSRERVEITLQHKEPDMVPLDLWGSASRLNSDLYKKLAAHFGLDWEKTAITSGPAKTRSMRTMPWRIASTAISATLTSRRARSISPIPTRKAM